MWHGQQISSSCLIKCLCKCEGRMMVFFCLIYLENIKRQKKCLNEELGKNGLDGFYQWFSKVCIVSLETFFKCVIYFIHTESIDIYLQSCFCVRASWMISCKLTVLPSWNKVRIKDMNNQIAIIKGTIYNKHDLFYKSQVSKSL